MAQVFVLVMKKALALIVVNLGVDIVVVAELWAVVVVMHAVLWLLAVDPDHLVAAVDHVVVGLQELECQENTPRDP